MIQWGFRLDAVRLHRNRLNSLLRQAGQWRWPVVSSLLFLEHSLLVLPEHVERLLELRVMRDHIAHILHVLGGDRFQEDGQIEQRSVGRVAVPLLQHQTVTSVQRAGVSVHLDLNGLGQVTIENVQVLDVFAFDESGGVLEQPVHYVAVLVHRLQNRKCGERLHIGEDHYLKGRRTDLLQELLQVRPRLAAPASLVVPIEMNEQTFE